MIVIDIQRPGSGALMRGTGKTTYAAFVAVAAQVEALMGDTSGTSNLDDFLDWCVRQGLEVKLYNMPK